ncbi:MAG: hypothetical protein IKY29_04915, partial [Clostridia bacterium]|nr:hypothetical protein [Clostridia bacterium]
PDGYAGWNVLTLDSLSAQKCREVFEYTRPFENGIFYHLVSADTLYYTRIIHGFYTRERIYIHPSNNRLRYFGEAFTQSDVNQAPDLSVYLSQLDLSSLHTGHLSNELLSTLELSHCSAEGWYTKVNGEVYGVIKVYWAYTEKGVFWGSPIYQDDLYYLVFSDGTMKEVEREELRQYIGDDHGISSFSYGEGYYQPVA